MAKKKGKLLAQLLERKAAQLKEPQRTVIKPAAPTREPSDECWYVKEAIR